MRTGRPWPGCWALPVVCRSVGAPADFTAPRRGGAPAPLLRWWKRRRTRTGPTESHTGTVCHFPEFQAEPNRPTLCCTEKPQTCAAQVSCPLPRHTAQSCSVLPGRQQQLKLTGLKASTFFKAEVLFSEPAGQWESPPLSSQGSCCLWQQHMPIWVSCHLPGLHCTISPKMLPHLLPFRDLDESALQKKFALLLQRGVLKVGAHKKRLLKSFVLKKSQQSTRNLSKLGDKFLLRWPYHRVCQVVDSFKQVLVRCPATVKPQVPETKTRGHTGLWH